MFARLSKLTKIDEDGLLELPEHTRENLLSFLVAELEAANELAFSVAPKPGRSKTITMDKSYLNDED